MKRLHVHVAVDDLAESIRFYSTLFATDPTVREADYAKWSLEDPRVNFAISARGRAPGIDHLGLQMETGEELRDVAARLHAAGRPVLEQQNTTCCYARGDKAWVLDPQGIRWESFHTVGAHTSYGEDPAPAPEAVATRAAEVVATPAPASSCGCPAKPAATPPPPCC
jgi:catechol 2,3-dioxygenase-like lactoylglutathione lyase family enzyme